MRCREVAPLVGPYVGGLLRGVEAESVAAHAAGCRRCQALIESERRFARLASRVSGARAPLGFAERVMDAVYQEALRGMPAPLEPAVQARAYRRIGLSFVLSAMVLAAALIVPAGTLPGLRGPGGLAAELNDRGSAIVRNVLRGADAMVRGALRPSAFEPAVIEGGSSR